MGINPPHMTAHNRLRKLLDRLLPVGWDSRIQGPITLRAGGSEPEPDYVLVRGSDADYETRHPGPTDIGLVVEVADSSLAEDRGDSQRIYARAGIVEYWIVNVPDRQIEVYTSPLVSADPPRYAVRTDYPTGATVPLTLGGLEVGSLGVSDVLP